jgi:hypothetical protein
MSSIKAYVRFYLEDFAKPTDQILFAESFLVGVPKR